MSGIVEGGRWRDAVSGRQINVAERSETMLEDAPCSL